MGDYANIPIPRAVYDKIQKLISADESLGYRSVSEFCLEAIRNALKEIEKKESK